MSPGGVIIGNCCPPEVVLLFTTKVVPGGVNDVWSTRCNVLSGTCCPPVARAVSVKFSSSWKMSISSVKVFISSVSWVLPGHGGAKLSELSSLVETSLISTSSKLVLLNLSESLWWFSNGSESVYFSAVDPCLTSGAMSLSSNGKSVSTQASTLVGGVFFPRNFPLLLKLYGFVFFLKNLDMKWVTVSLSFRFCCVFFFSLFVLLCNSTYLGVFFLVRSKGSNQLFVKHFSLW